LGSTVTRIVTAPTGTTKLRPVLSGA
jgi:hypothetical protein